ncbi:MAG: YncE family protein, partial [Planctomycetota bacterium]
MKNDYTNHVLKARILAALLAVTLSMNAVTTTATGKSLYVNADIKGASLDKTQPVQAYDIGVDGTLTFQAQHDIPHRRLGAVGMAIDSDSGYVFITYESGDTIQLLDPITMTDAGTTMAPDASDLAGIVYDHKKNLLYTVDRHQEVLYVYDWDPETATLAHVEGSPFTLRRATAYGIALDEIDDLLYMANAGRTVTVYSTSDWELVNTITLSRIAISIAVD